MGCSPRGSHSRRIPGRRRRVGREALQDLGARLGSAPPLGGSGQESHPPESARRFKKGVSLSPTLSVSRTDTRHRQGTNTEAHTPSGHPQHTHPSPHGTPSLHLHAHPARALLLSHAQEELLGLVHPRSPTLPHALLKGEGRWANNCPKANQTLKPKGYI